MNIIIMHNKERTVKTCYDNAKSQGIPHLVHAKPFSKTLRNAFEMAVDIGDEWCVLTGGDILMNDGAIEQIENDIKLCDKNTFRISYSGWDHLLMCYRLMAPCAYRVNMLKEALKIDFSSRIRPETYVAREMRKSGYKIIIDPDTIIAIHDKDQYYKDIYLKGVAQIHKSKNFIYNNELIPAIKLSKNPDHRVFFMGIEDGGRNHIRSVRKVYKYCGVNEKTPI